MNEAGLFAADVGGQIVFLNVARNRYLAVAREILAPFLVQEDERGRFTPAEIERAATALRQVGWPNAGAQSAPLPLTSHNQATRSLELSPLKPTRLADPRAAISLLRAAQRLKRQRLAEIVKSRLAHRSKIGRSSNPTQVIERSLAFAAWRPLASDKDRCLCDSLALSKYLGREGKDVDWVFGVSAPFFLAHCWLQMGDLVLNDSIEHTRQYAPIMIV